MITLDLDRTIEACLLNFSSIPDERKSALQELSKIIKNKELVDKVNLTFICVHNSRRSHLAQIWAQIAAHYYEIENVHCYSGGSEVTEMYPAAVNILQKNGLLVQQLSTDENPVYTLKYAESAPPIRGFSKLFDDSFNPQTEFAAIMVCFSSDSNCPYIANATERLLISYQDPKEFDGTELQNEKYLERSLQIATEMLYAFSLV
jgi:arsenate reductase (thioredoxin)